MIEKIEHCGRVENPSVPGHLFRCNRLKGHAGDCFGVHQKVEARRGGWIQTYSGKQFWPMDTRVGDFRLEDFAHALSQICRFAGHTRQPYSVAQHSVLVSYQCPNYPLEGLLHDVTEAYLVDVPRPVKHDPIMHGYRQIEADMEFVLASQFNLHCPWPEEVKQADNILLVTERRDLLKRAPFSWGPELEALTPLPKAIIPWPQAYAEARFLRRYYELTHY